MSAGRRRSRSRKHEADSEESDSDGDQLTSSRTESSNQLDAARIKQSEYGSGRGHYLEPIRLKGICAQFKEVCLS